MQDIRGTIGRIRQLRPLELLRPGRRSPHFLGFRRLLRARAMVWMLVLVLVGVGLNGAIARDRERLQRLRTMPTAIAVPAPPRPLAASGSPRLAIALSEFLQTGTVSADDYEDRPAGVPIDTIILHHTGVGSRNRTTVIPESWQNDPRTSSAHFVIGRSGEVIMAIPPTATAFHILKQAAYPDPETGKPVNWINQRSLGIEFNYDPSREVPTEAAIAAGGKLIGALFNTYRDLDVRRILGHGIQTFRDNRLGRPVSEPTHLLMTPDLRPSPLLPKLLAAAATISPAVADAAAAAGGVEALAQQLCDQTLAGRDLSLTLDHTWQADSGLPVSPLSPLEAVRQRDAIVAGSRPHRWANP
jgi:hypothetical protein